MIKNWIVTMRCVVTKEVFVDNCSKEDAKNNPWDFATDEQEVEQVDWEVLKVRPNEYVK